MREPDARANHRSGYNCAQSVTAAFAEELGVSRDSAASSAPRPRSEGGKCGAYLAGCQLLSRLKPDAVEAFKARFLEENGAVDCVRLRLAGKPCNDLVGCAARLVEELAGPPR